MKCNHCSKKAIFHRKISNETLCEDHFVISIEKKIQKTVRKYKMFNPQTKVAVGVSGGKDSLVLLYNVIKLQRRNPDCAKTEAILIDEGIKNYREESTSIAKEMCRKWDVPLHIVSFKDNFGKDLDTLIPKLLEKKINACTICGTVRRRLLNQKSKEIGADKLAIGHNLDDQSQTFLANIVRKDFKKIAQNPPFGNPEDLEHYFVPRIKPLMNIPEEEITRYCYYKNIPIQQINCPYIENFPILRERIQRSIQILEKQSAETKYNLISANEELHHILQFYYSHHEKSDIPSKNNCYICNSPCGSNREICYYCELKSQFLND